MVDWATVLASVSFSVLGSLLVTEFQIRREQSVEESQEVRDWYDTSSGYASQVRREWDRLWDSAERPEMNLSEIQGEMSLLESQISRHATEGEQMDVDEDVVEALDDLAVECRRPSDRTLHSESVEVFEDLREDIIDAVEDLEEALQSR